EASYLDLGDSTITNTLLSEENPIQVSHSLWQAALIYQANDLQFLQVTPYLKLGIASLNLDSKSDVLIIKTEQQTKPIYGAGFNFAISNQWHVKNEFEFINLNDSYWASLSIEYKFGANKGRHYSPKALITMRKSIKEDTSELTRPSPSKQLIETTESQYSYCESLAGFDQAIHFLPYTSTITPDSKNTLLNIAQLQTKNNAFGLRYEVKGYAEAVGQPAISLTLSEKRAITVKEFLVSLGVSIRTLIYQGYGELPESDIEFGAKIAVLNAPKCDTNY
ncbi:MAG: OmpA family protein, partial [Colwellia sp.]